MVKYFNLAPFEPKDNYFLDGLNDVSILIKTLERKEHLINLLDSILHYGFSGPIVIGDDSKIAYKDDILSLFPTLSISYLVLPYDTGTAEGRNKMLEITKTKYFLLCDDDFIFDRRTRIPLMMRLLVENNLDILGGVFRQHNRKTRKGKFLLKLSLWLRKFGWVLPSSQIFEYQSGIEFENGKLFLRKVEYKDPMTICDLTHNFFLANTEKVKSFGGWNSILKGGEHQNFFIRAKLAGLKVGTTRLCGVIHDQWTPNSDEYMNLRNRGNEYQEIALKEFGFHTIENYKEVLGGKFGK
jgi:glycosyltransferase involved in cell wall biosynthesis